MNPNQEYTAVSLAVAGAITTTGNQTGVDILNFDGHGMVILNSAAGTGTTPTLDVKLQDSADNSSFADVSGAAFTQVTGAASFQTIDVDLSAIRRYVRVVDTVSGTTPSFARSVSLVGRSQAE
jgi:hypothetical protein